MIVGCFFSCSKKLDIKPDSALLIPKSLVDLENLLDNTTVMNGTPGLPQISADEYYIPTLANFQSLAIPITRTAYTWQKDIFEGKGEIFDWNQPYEQIFYCNNVLEVIAKQEFNNDAEVNRIKGWALFNRAYAFYGLVSTFSKAYDPNTANTDLGVPLKLDSDINIIIQRSSVQKVYDQIIKDASEAADLLQQDIPLEKRNRPSKVAAYAFLARVYLSMRKYDLAELYSDKELQLYSKLTDYKTLTVKTTSSFTFNSEETIYFSFIYGNAYSQISSSAGSLYGIDLKIIALYEPYDLRKIIYFTQNINGNYYSKGINSPNRPPFTGLATDEIYLIKAECLARKGETALSMNFLNQLLIKRWNPNAITPSKSYQTIVANDPEDALNKILTERMKTLIWRSLRWTDLKRLNLEGRNLVITRNLSGEIYTLEPNSPRYVMPIPDDEISRSRLQQNIR